MKIYHRFIFLIPSLPPHLIVVIIVVVLLLLIIIIIIIITIIIIIINANILLFLPSINQAVKSSVHDIFTSQSHLP